MFQSRKKRIESKNKFKKDCKLIKVQEVQTFHNLVLRNLLYRLQRENLKVLVMINLEGCITKDLFLNLEVKKPQ